VVQLVEFQSVVIERIRNAGSVSGVAGGGETDCPGRHFLKELLLVILIFFIAYLQQATYIY